MYKLISYPLKEDDAVWPGCFTVAVEPVNCMSRGEAFNTFVFKMSNHFGTHFDAPRHFVADGTPIGELPMERFIYERPLLLDIPKGSMEKIEAEDLAAHAKEIEKCDLLMIRTGFSKYRDEDKETYCERGPAVSSRAAKYLLDNFTGLKALALDMLSLASYSDGEDGTLSHQYMLGAHHDHFVCIIEDVDMRELTPGKIKRVFAAPVFVVGLDSSPVTVLAEVE